MKKTLLLFIALLISTFSFAEKKVASYIMSGIERDIEATIDSKGKLNVFVSIMGKYDHDNVMFKIEGEDQIIGFAEKLQSLNDKFVEWAKVAKSNNVSDYTKKFDIPFPRVEIYWAGSSKWYSSYKGNFMNFIFIVSESGEPSLGCGGTAKHWDNEYIDQQFYIIFISTEEIKSLINALNVDSLKKALNSTSNTDALFQ